MQMVEQGRGPEKPAGLAQGTAAELRARALNILKGSMKPPDQTQEQSTPSPASTEPGTNPAVRMEAVKKALQYGSGAKGSEQDET